MNRHFKTTLLAGAMAACAMPALAQELKIAFLSTLSGPPAVLGQHMRDGFLLGLKQKGGKLGGIETQVIVTDDELKPDVAVQKVRGHLERDKVDIVAGVVFSNVMMAVAKPVTDGGAVLISGNAGPSPLAGKGCHANFVSVSYQNDQNHEVLGKHAQDKGFKRVFLMAPNYQAGKDSLAGFKRHFKGEVLDEVYTQLGQLDFAAELARIAALKPDAVFAFMPGGMGVNLVRQYGQAGLTKSTPFLSAFTVDETVLPATQEAALGMFSGAGWAPNLDNPANKAFVAAFEKEYGYVPALYAAHGYDTAMLIDAAVTKLGGKVADKAELAKALKTTDFPSVRGKVTFGNNGFPIQDFYLVKVAKRADGKFQTEIAEKVFSQYQDVYAKDCPLK